MVGDEQLSRAVSHALRHEPELYELEPDAQGWVATDQLVEGLASQGGRWSAICAADVERMVSTATKARHEVRNGRIRARYGHSLSERVVYEPAAAPDRLFHGTSAEAWPTIGRQGLRPMGRQYVHLSVDQEAAWAVGRRKSTRPVLLVVTTRHVLEEGETLYAAGERIWLADRVPAAALSLLEPTDTV